MKKGGLATALAKAPAIAARDRNANPIRNPRRPPIPAPSRNLRPKAATPGSGDNGSGDNEIPDNL